MSTKMQSERILIWEVNWLGDVLFSTPFIKAVRKKFKDAYIAVIVTPSLREILEGNPRINEIILYDEKGECSTIFGKIKFISKLKKKNFNTAFLLHRSLSRAVIAFLAGIRRRVGYFYKKRNFILTDVVDIPEKGLHKVEYFLNIAKHIGADSQDKNLEFYIQDEDRNYIDELLKRNEISVKDHFFVLNPGANWPPKRWPEENFAELSDRLIKTYGAKVVISGAGTDAKKTLCIQEMATNRLANLCGKTTLKQLGALFERAGIVISGDSGPLHLAIAVGTKAVALFGPTSPELTGPYGNGDYSTLHKNIGCEVPCYEVLCSDNKCMKAITVDDVMEAVKKFL